MKILLATAAAIAAATSANAAVVVDQSALVPTIGSANVVSRIGLTPATQTAPQIMNAAVQTFTASSAGQLVQIDIQAFNTGAMQGFLALSLIDGDYAAGARDVLTSRVFAFGALPSVNVARMGPTISFDVTDAAFRVQAGTRYSIIFEAVATLGFNTAGLLVGTGTPPVTGVDPTFYRSDYAGGALYAIRDGVFQPAGSQFDVGFVSYVDADIAAVPEPATWAILLIGFGLAGAALRRPRKITVAYAA